MTPAITLLKRILAMHAYVLPPGIQAEARAMVEAEDVIEKRPERWHANCPHCVCPEPEGGGDE